MQQSRGDCGKGFDFFKRYTESDETEPGARPGKESAFRSEEVAGEGAGIG